MLQRAYGPIDGLRPEEVAAPTPADGQVRVQVVATSMHADVWHAVNGHPIVARFMNGLFRPTNPIPGTDFAGRIESVGPGVTRWSVGDAVYGEVFPDRQWRNGGTFAELVVVDEGAVVAKPDHLSFEEAAAGPTAGIIALRNLPRAAVKPGAEVLVNGAGGAVGTIAVQLAKAWGARVTAVDAGPKQTMLQRIGADAFIDYTQQDVRACGARFDVVFDVASTFTLETIDDVLAPDGQWVPIGHDHYGAEGRAVLGTLPRFFGLLLRSRRDPRLGLFGADHGATLQEFAALVADRTVTPVADPTVFALEDAVAAMEHLRSGQARGRVILRVGQDVR